MFEGNLAILGAQWGDEGKGKIVDLLCEEFDVVARFQGGHNAGHTVKFADKHYSLHLIPSGILHAGKTCVLGNGMVIDPYALLGEVRTLREAGVAIDDNLRISTNAHCILPIHSVLDKARESTAGDDKIGTTGRGIGPAYETKYSRHGVLMGDLRHRSTLETKVDAIYREKNALLSGLYQHEAMSVQECVETYMELGAEIEPWLTDTVTLLLDALDAGERIMYEGAQGAFLDVDHGTYPFVTSSNCTAGGISTGLGVPPSAIDNVLGIVKAYTTRVGEGPFPTELHDEMGEHLRKRGNEFGTTTGRPRRTGWLDLVILRKSARISGMTSLALTKLDVLDEVETIRVCTSYDEKGEPVYENVAGWSSSTVGMTSYEELPAAARDYVSMIENAVGCPISVISTGPRREETIVR